MQKKFQIRGGLVIQVPRPFHRQQLTHHQQLRDKEIRKQLEALEQKRQEDKNLQAQWRNEKEELERLKSHHQQKDQDLLQQQKTLSAQIFRLQIRKEQILSRTDPSVVHKKQAVLMQYFKCIPYTVGNRLQKVNFWGGEEKYFRLKFLVEFGRDRFLRKSQTQKQIFGNLERVVLCRKVKFDGQLVMLTVKEVSDFIADPSTSCQKMSKLCPTVSFSQTNYQLQLYSITGTNWVLRRVYAQKELLSWTTLFANNKFQKCSKQRVSVAETLARQNALREFVSKIASDHQQQGSSSNNDLSSGQAFANKKSALNLYNNSLNFEVTSNNLTELLENKDESFSEAPNLSTYKQSNYSNESECLEGSDDREEEYERKLHGQCRQRDGRPSGQLSYMGSRRSARFSLCPKSTSFRPSLERLNKPFLGGREVCLFPPSDPLLNIVVLKYKCQLFMLPEYLSLQRGAVVRNVVYRMRSKVLIKHELKKCLFYKIMKVDHFYQTKLSQSCSKDSLLFLSSLELPLLFMIKQRHSQRGPQLILSCTSITTHPDYKKVVNFSSSQNKENKDEKNRRVSVSKNIAKNNLIRKSKDFKSKLGSKQSKDPSEKYQKYPYLGQKKKDWIGPSLTEKFNQFMTTHTISLVNRCFYPRSFVIKALKSIVKVQARFKQLFQRIKYKDIGALATLTFKLLPQNRIFISSLFSPSSPSSTVIVESLEAGQSHLSGKFVYQKEHEPIIKSQIMGFDREGTLREVKEELNTRILEAIEENVRLRAKLERERPQKQRNIIRRFMYMFYLRLKAKSNIFFIKKVAVKQRMFVLVIRRDDRFRQVLQCSLFDLGSRSLNCSVGREGGSEIGWQKQASHNSNKELGRSFSFQRIHLPQKYFRDIDKRSIGQQFFIDHRAFLLKPPKSPNIYYIQRLSSLDINSEDIAKAFISIDKEQSSQKQNCFAISSKSIKCLLNGSSHPTKQQLLPSGGQGISITDNALFSSIPPASNNSSSLLGTLKAVSNPRRLYREKKNSIESEEGNFLSLIKPSPIRECQPAMYSKASLAESTSNRRLGCRIQGNSHDSIIYYSLFKGSDVFFYLDLYLVTKTLTERSYTQNLSRLSRQRLYKKQIEDKGMDLVMRKVAEWLIENEEEYVTSREMRMEDNQSQVFLEGGLCMIKNCLQLIETQVGKQRFSLEEGKIICPQEKHGRTNTFTQ